KQKSSQESYERHTHSILSSSVHKIKRTAFDNRTAKAKAWWIKNPESQANATVFLAKFYGRAGLMNLINAGPDHLRPGLYR
ncbi:hypothetical protein Taro_020965, partial [Colocasia esculenta]|nr:hypothetical protein [Colocasia esculenta]